MEHKDWEEMKKKILELDEMEFASDKEGLLQYIDNLLALKNEEHQRLILEENRIAREMERERIVAFIGKMKEEPKLVIDPKDSEKYEFVNHSQAKGYNRAVAQIITSLNQQ